MARILVLFGTTDGHTAKVAQAVGRRLQSRSHHADIVNAATDETDPSAYDAIIVAASVHTGSYQRQIVRWAAKHSATLNLKPTAFVSVCLGTLEHKAEVDRRLRAILDAFARSTSWTPGETKIVAGALKYSHYNVLKRWVMKRIVKKAGGDTDSTRDYEYTDWNDLEQFTDRFADRLVPTISARSA